MGKGGGGEGRSLAETPTWALATVVSAMVALGFFFHGSLKQLGKWLDRTKRKALLAALEKIKEELMVFGLLSLLMGHWIIFVDKICVKSSALSSRFYPCLSEADTRESVSSNATVSSSSMHLNHSLFHEQLDSMQQHFCPQGHESFASYESLEQLHRFLFALGVTHVFYSFAAIALAMIKIYSWKTWENQAKSVALSESQGNPEAASNSIRMRQLSTFIFLHTSHPWSQHRILVWLLCFGRQFWSSIYQADYMALRLGFITTHQLPLSYDFHNYMFRSMEEEFRDIVGISVPLWIFAILCIFLDFHVVKLAVEIMDRCQLSGVQCFNLRDELFWFGRPRLLLLLIQFISFQNAFEMATFVWSQWESKGTSCFMENRSYIVIRLTFGLVSQFWCSFITFPLYVIVTQMGSRFKESIVSENVRKSLHGWQRRVRAKHGSSSFTFLNTTTSTSSLDLSVDEIEKMHTVGPSSMEERSSRSHEDLSDTLGLSEISASEETIQTVPCYDSSNENSTLW